MGLKICLDPSVKKLRKLFDANILRIPEERIKPLTVVARIDGKNHWWGEITTMVDGDLLEVDQLISVSQMADVSNQVSKSVDADLGLKILDGFLKGFHLPSAGIIQHFEGAKSVSFSFQNVERTYIAPSDLDQMLIGIPLDTNLGIIKQMINGDANLYIIDSIITSTNFSIHVDRSTEKDFEIDLPSIEKLVSKVDNSVKVKYLSRKSISFEGDQALTFAFSCLQCKTDDSGTIMLIPKNLPSQVFNSRERNDLFSHQFLSDGLEMMELE